jgi:hypothetical protein
MCQQAEGFASGIGFDAAASEQIDDLLLHVAEVVVCERLPHIAQQPRQEGLISVGWALVILLWGDIGGAPVECPQALFIVCLEGFVEISASELVKLLSG